MSRISFVSHEYFPEDEYTKELVYLCLDQLYRVGYVRKKTKHGGFFWDVISLGITKDGKKEFYPSFIQDSNFLERDIKDFLDKRKWEDGKSQVMKEQSLFQKPPENLNDDPMPF